MTFRTQTYVLIAMQTLRAFMIAMPIIVLYWQSHGLSIQDIFILQVIFSIAIVAFEIPSGYFADLYGRKWSITLGSITGTLGFLLYYTIPSYFGFVVAELALALSFSFLSGAQSALLFETLKADGRREEYTKYQGRLMASGRISEAAAAILAGIVAAFSSIETVLLIQWIVIGLTIPLSLGLKDVRNTHGKETPTLLKTITGSVRENRRLRYLNIYAGCIGAAGLTMVWFAQPHWKELGINILYFGYLWAILNLVTAFGSELAHRVERLFKFRTLFGWMAILPFLLYGLMSTLGTSLLALAIVPFFWLLRGIFAPIIQDYVQRECDDESRATVLSINALATRLIFSICSPFLGWIADVWSFQTAFAASALVFGVLSVGSFLLLYGAMGEKSTV